MRIRVKPAGWAFLLFLLGVLIAGRIVLHQSLHLGNGTAVDLSDAFTRDGISYDSNPGDGGLDATPNMTLTPTNYSVEQLGGSQRLSLGSTNFEMGPFADGRKNVVDTQGQTITLPSGHYRTLMLLATSVNGDADDTFTVGYGSGSPQSTSLRITDWCQAPHGSEAGTKPMDYRNGADGGEKVGLHISSFPIPLDPAKEVRSVRLPKNDHIKIFAMTLLSS